MIAEEKIHKLIILGSGPAGYTAAIYAARANLAPIIISGPLPGGQLTQTTEVENWPGGDANLQGIGLIDNLKAHALRFDTKIIEQTVLKVDLSEKPFTLTTNKAEYKTQSLIIATGASAKYLGIESEQKFLNKGISACATCDGFFYQQETVAVVGGGNTAIEEALYMSNIAKKVHLIHRGDSFRAEKILVDRLLKKPNLEIHYNYEVYEILGDSSGVNGVRIKSNLNSDLKNIDLLAVFIAIGHTPNTGIFGSQLKTNNGYITVTSGLQGKATATSVPGVFAAGDVMDQIYRQAITSAGTGAMAALDAEKYLDSL